MTKHPLALLLSLLISSATLFAGDDSVAADRDWASLEKVLHGGADEARPTSQADAFVGIFRNIVNYLRAAEGFIGQYPNDPRRWDAVLNMKDFYGAALNMLEKQDAATTARIDAFISPAEREEWSRRVKLLEQQFQAAQDVSPATRYRADIEPWFNALFALMKQKLPEDSPEWSELRAGLDRLAAAYPDLGQTRDLVKHYTNVRFSEGKDTPARRAELASLAASPNQFIRAAVEEQLHFLDLAREPLELAFTAVDGRKVDLRDLRGKVVLIDFWATWCGPCIEEIPTVKKVYGEYRDKGFEVIGITLENPHFRPTDSEAQQATKLAAARERLLKFVAAKEMSWPQHFDGKWWKNEFARRFAIESIPAMFLLDQEGRLVSTNARGPKLEAEVKRLLGL